MRLLSAPLAAAALSSTLFSLFAHGQTYTTCNPLDQSCPADPALGGSTRIDFSSGASSDFSSTGDGVSYNSNGAQLGVSTQGEAPTLSSKWYLMFGHVDFVFKSAPGVGMVSSAILISDDLDEIDWELLGAKPSEAQTNYFGKGVTGSYNRATTVSAPSSQSEFNTYSVDWTSERILWQINGVTVRTLEYAEADGQYPQTPMQIKVGSWAGGDPSNSPGTITWAGGPINYSGGPYIMQVQSISATDYSTGTAYQYSGTDGTWQEVKALGGGSVNPGAGSGSAPATPVHPDPVSGTSPSPSSTSSYLASLGYDPHHRHTSHAPSLPSSPPSSAGAPAAGGCETFTEYNQKGFLMTVTAPSGWSKSYNDQGVLATPPPCTAHGGKGASVPTTLAAITTASPNHTMPSIPSGSKTSPPFSSADSLQTTNTIFFATGVCAVAALALFL